MLAEEYGLDAKNDQEGWRLDAACTAWEEAAYHAFWSEVERTARYHVYSP
jgi:hypothetical protein